MKKLLATSVLALLVSAGAAQAVGEPIAYGEADLGTLRVVAGVLVADKTVDLKGAWFDDGKSCTTTQPLKISVSLTYSSTTTPPKTRMAKRSGTFRGANCAEGGPNVGFRLKPAAVKAACRNGHWKPGQYAFNTSVTDTTAKLTAHASLLWLVDKPC